MSICMFYSVKMGAKVHADLNYVNYHVKENCAIIGNHEREVGINETEK